MDAENDANKNNTAASDSDKTMIDNENETKKDKTTDGINEVNKIKDATTNGDKTKTVKENVGDIAFYTKLCKEVLTMRDIAEVKAVRLGSKQSDKCRPLKISFLNIWDKRKFLSSLPKLKNQVKYKDVRVAHDMSIEDRHENAKLLKQAYEMNKKEQPKEFKYKVRGPPWEMKIVKIYAKN